MPERKVGGIEVDVTCGYGDAGEDVPEPLRQAIRLLVAHWYENRGVVAVDQAIAMLPQTVAALIAPYRVLGAMTTAGELNRRLVLEAPVESPDGAGGVTRAYAPAMTVWAKVEPVSARNAVVADAPGATITHRITIRQYAAVTTRHRFVEGSTVYRIVSLREDGSRRFLIIGAEQRAD